MTGYDEFNAELENLRQAFRATSPDISTVHAKLVGALSAIVPMLADDRSLRIMAQAMQDTVKRETMKVLKQAPTQ